MPRDLVSVDFLNVQPLNDRKISKLGTRFHACDLKDLSVDLLVREARDVRWFWANRKNGVQVDALGRAPIT
jgi:hypothetical protein